MDFKLVCFHVAALSRASHSRVQCWWNLVDETSIHDSCHLMKSELPVSSERMGKMGHVSATAIALSSPDAAREKFA